MQILLEILTWIVVITTFLMLATAIISIFMGVPYVPSRMNVVHKMIRVAKLKKNEVVYDLGCGDGRLLLEAAKTKTIQAKGYEAAPIPFLLAKLKNFIHRAKIKIYPHNFFKADLKDANVIFCYLGPETMNNLYKKLKKECRKGTRIISNTFSIHEARPTRVWTKNPKQKLPTIYLYEI
jgi:ribosomal protein L11 methylase PrmA